MPKLVAKGVDDMLSSSGGDVNVNVGANEGTTPADRKREKMLQRTRPSEQLTQHRLRQGGMVRQDVLYRRMCVHPSQWLGGSSKDGFGGSGGAGNSSSLRGHYVQDGSQEVEAGLSADTARRGGSARRATA